MIYQVKRLRHKLQLESLSYRELSCQPQVILYVPRSAEGVAPKPEVLSVDIGRSVLHIRRFNASQLRSRGRAIGEAALEALDIQARIIKGT